MASGNLIARCVINQKSMKRAKKLLDNAKGCVKKPATSIKKRIALWKRDSTAIKQLVRSARILDESGDSVSAAVYCYLDYRSGDRDNIERTVGDAKLLALQDAAEAAKKSGKAVNFEAAKAVLNEPLPVKPSRLKMAAANTKNKIAEVNSRISWKKLLKWTLIMLAVVAVIWLGFRALQQPNKVVINNPQPVEESKPDKCPAPSWEINQTFNANPNNDWQEGGYAPLGTASTAEEAKAAHEGYMRDVIYPSTANLYGYVSEYIAVIDGEVGNVNYDRAAASKLGFDRFYQHKSVKEILAKYKDNPNGFSDNGCATPDAIKIRNYMESFAFDADSQDVTATGGVNTGIKPNGEVILYDGNITGNLDSIKVNYKLRDGTVITVYELARCANPVYSQKHHNRRHHHDRDRDKDKPRCDNCLTPKDPSKDVGANPKVSDQKKDGGDKHSVNRNDGATDPQGLQDNPQADAAEAEAKAEEKAADNQQAHEDAKEEAEEEGGGTVDDNQEHTESTAPAW